MPSPIAHSLAGLALGQAVPDPRRRLLLLPLLVVAANLPDLDFIPGMLLGNADRFHHGPSHSLLVGLALAAAAGWLVARRAGAGTGRRIGLLVAAGYSSHVLLDMLCLDTRLPVGVPLLWPLWGGHLASPVAVFMDIQRHRDTALFLGSLLGWHNLRAAAWEMVVMGGVAALASLAARRRRGRAGEVAAAGLTTAAGAAAVPQTGDPHVPTHLAIMDVSPDKRGSFESYTVKLARRLGSEGWRTVQAFWGRPPGWLRAELEAAGAEVRVISDEPEFGGRADQPPGLARDWRLARVARRWIGELEPDVVHLHFCVVFSLLPLALRLAGARNLVFTEHISLPFTRRNPLRDVAAWARNRLCMLCVRRALAVSDYVRRRLVLSDHVPAAKTAVLYNGIDLERFQPAAEGAEGAEVAARVRARLGLPAGQRLVVTIGQLIDFKGIHVLIDAAAVLAGRREPGDRVTYLVIGEGERRQALEEQAARLGLGERCRFLGRRDDVADILRACDLFVLPSVWDEALGYVVVEAMAAGKAVVASRAGGIPEVVADGLSGLLVERGDATALAAAIGSLLDDEPRRLAMGAAGRRLVEEKFSMHVSIEQTVQLYGELAGIPKREPKKPKKKKKTTPPLAGAAAVIAAAATAFLGAGAIGSARAGGAAASPPLPAPAQATRVVLPALAGAVGERLTTDLILEGAPGITGITLEIGFDAGVVAPDTEIIMGELGGSLQNIHGANVIGGDTLRVAVAVWADTTGYVGDGVLLSIDWQLLAGGTSPLAFLSVLLEDNQSPPPLPAEPLDGSIQVALTPVEESGWGGLKLRYEGGGGWR